MKGEWKDWEEPFAPFGFKFEEWFTTRASGYPEDLALETWHDMYAKFAGHDIFSDINGGRSGADLKGTYSVTDAPCVDPGLLEMEQHARWAIQATSSCPESMCPTRAVEVFAEWWLKATRSSGTNRFRANTRRPSDAPF